MSFTSDIVLDSALQLGALAHRKHVDGSMCWLARETLAPAVATIRVVRCQRDFSALSANRHNSYQWDFVMNDGDFFKGGFGGQGLYISPSRDLVIAFFGTFGPSRSVTNA